MEFCFVPHRGVTLIGNPESTHTKLLLGAVEGKICKNPEDGNDSEDKFLSMLGNSVAKANSVGSKRQKLDTSINTTFTIFIKSYLMSGKSYFRIGHLDQSNNNKWLPRLQRACGGADKCTFDVDIIFSGFDNFHVQVREKQIRRDSTWEGLHHDFRIPLPIIQQWREKSRIYIELSIKVKLSDDAVERIYHDNLENPPVANKAMLLDLSTSDAILVAGNGVEVKCHKAILSAHSDVFKSMLESELKKENSTTIQVPEMNEASARALLGYLYRSEIKEISKSPEIAFELLVAADKYNIPKLLGSARDLILLKANKWFTPSVAIRLLQFAKNKGELGEIGRYSLVKEKSIAVLKSIPKKKLHDCLDLQQLFANQQAGLELFCYILHD